MRYHSLQKIQSNPCKVQEALRFCYRYDAVLFLDKSSRIITKDIGGFRSKSDNRIGPCLPH